MSDNRKRMVVTGIGLVVIVMALLFGSAGMTAYAAQSALPGDTLYGVKTSLEQTRISMARDASVRADLYLEFAENRLEEISRLIADKRYKDISAATIHFERYADQAIAELDVVAQGDPQQAAVLTGRISEALSRYSRTLTSMLNSVPEDVRVQMQQVIEAAQPQGTPVVQATEVEFSGVVENIVTGAWKIAGRTVFIHTQTEVKGSFQVGDFVKVHAVVNGDGDLVAREIESADRDDDANSNDDDNSNSNSNDDDANSNDDDDDNANSNSNDDDANSNDDDDDNSNSNSNDDDDDDSNSNSSNSNDDDDDDDSNDNSSPGNNNDDDDSDPGNSNDDDSNDDSGNSNDNDDDDDSNENDD